MRNQYFSPWTTEPEKGYRIVAIHEDAQVSLQQRKRGRQIFLVRYGQQVDAEMHYPNAALALGAALMHHYTCEGKLVDTVGE